MPYHQPALRTGRQRGLPYIVRFEAGVPIPPVPPVPPVGVTVTIPEGATGVTFSYENSEVGLYVLTATPSGGALAGHGACSTALAAIMPTGMSINSVVVTTQIGQQPIAFIGRTDVRKISIIDTLTPGVSVSGIGVRLRPVMMPNRNRCQCVRIKVFGSGSIAGGSLIVTPDLNDARAWTTSAADAVPASQMNARTEGVLFWLEPPPDMIGYCFDLTISNVTATSFIMRHQEYELNALEN